MTICTRLARLLCTAAVALGFCHATFAQNGACCSSAGVCTQTAASSCTTSGTSFLGIGTTCAPTDQCAALADSLAFERARSLSQRSQIERLATALPLPQLMLPLLAGGRVDHGALLSLAAMLSDALRLLPEPS